MKTSRHPTLTSLAYERKRGQSLAITDHRKLYIPGRRIIEQPEKISQEATGFSLIWVTTSPIFIPKVAEGLRAITLETNTPLVDDGSFPGFQASGSKPGGSSPGHSLP
jgi:hypothetical protein